MIISLSYSLGDSSRNKYFDSYQEMVDFLNEYLDIFQTDSEYFQLSISRGNEEDRIRDIIKKTMEKKT